MAVVEDILQTRLNLVGLGTWTNGFGVAERVVRMFSKAEESAAESSTRLAARVVVATSAAASLVGILARSTQEAAKMERLGVAFASVTGGASEAAAEMKDLKGSDAAKLFGDEAIARAAIRLRSYGADAAFTQQAINALGNAAATTADSNESFAASAEVVSRAIQEQRVSGRDLLRMVNNGIPVIDILAKKMGIARNAVKDLDLEGPMATRALKMLFEGIQERDAGAMSRAMNTLDGATAALGNSAQRTGAILGGPFLSAGTAVAKMATSILDGFNGLPKPIQDTASTLAVFAVGALGNYIRNVTVSISETATLAKETMALANAHMKAAEAANVHASAESRVASTAIVPVAGGGAVALAGGGKGGGGNAAAALAILMGADLAVNMMPDKGAYAPFKGIFNRGVQGAGIGMMFGPEGALIGAAGGAILGGVEQLYKKPGKDGDKTLEQLLAEQRRANDIAEKQLSTMELLRQNGPIDTSVLAGSFQTQIMNQAYGG